MDAYVKFVESAGARVIPIVYNSDLSSILSLMDHINGVFYPGGNTEDEKFS